MARFQQVYLPIVPIKETCHNGDMWQQRPYFPQHRLGYRRNPFGALTPEEWQTIAFLPEVVRPWLNQRGLHLQLLGPMGCGKSSTLHKILAELETAQHVAYEYVAEGETRFKTDLADLNCFLLDEAQRLNWWWRWRWLRSAESTRLIFSSHEDLSPHFRRRGLALQTIDLATAVSPASYTRWIEQRLIYFALAGKVARATIAPEAVLLLYETYGPSMREAEYFLYEVWQQLAQVEVVTPAHLRRAGLPG